MRSLSALIERSLSQRLRIVQVELVDIQRDRWVYRFRTEQKHPEVQGRAVIEWREKPVVLYVDLS